MRRMVPPNPLEGAKHSMLRLSPVVWTEGMHLAQHHFQAQNRYLEEAVRFGVSQLYFRPYGLVGYELSADALLNGSVEIVHARGLLPDGTPFSFPDDDPRPPGLDLTSLFGTTESRRTVFLTLPEFKTGRANCVDAETGGEVDTRFIAEEKLFSDDTTGSDPRPVTLGRRNFRLALDGSVPHSAVTLPLARVRRDSSGRFSFDPDFIPPAMQIGASRRLTELVDRLIELLVVKADALSVTRPAGRALARYGDREVASFWLSHTLHSGIAPLRHHARGGRSHPEQVFSDLSQLAGALCTFSLDADAGALPLYDHDDLEGSFGELDRHVRKLLEVTLPDTSVSIALSRRSMPNIFTGKVPDERCFGDSEWILEVTSERPASTVIREIEGKLKFASMSELPLLVKTAGMRGLAVERVAVPPRQIAPRPGAHYFRILREGAIWDSVQDEAAVGVWISDEVVEAELDLMVILPD